MCIADPKCYFNVQFYATRDVIKDNCKICNCQRSTTNNQCMEVRCESKTCLIDERTIEELDNGFNAGLYTWKASRNYSDFWGRSLSEGFKKKLGTIRPERTVSFRVSRRRFCTNFVPFLSIVVSSAAFVLRCVDRSMYLDLYSRVHNRTFSIKVFLLG